MAEATSLKVLVVDDEPVARDRIERLLADHGQYAVRVAGDGPSAVEAIRAWRPDIVLLDVQMPGFDGFQVVSAVGPASMPPTVFVTAYDEHAARAFDAEALDYLVKPYDDERFELALARVRRRLDENRLRDLGARFEAMLSMQRPAPADEATIGDASTGQMDRVVLRTGGRARIVKTDDVDWFEADGMYARVHLPGESHLVRIAMHELEARLDPARFIRVHRSAIVNIDRVRELREIARGEWAIVLTNGFKVKLSRSRRAALERRLGQSL